MNEENTRVSPSHNSGYKDEKVENKNERRRMRGLETLLIWQKCGPLEFSFSCPGPPAIIDYVTRIPVAWHCIYSLVSAAWCTTHRLCFDYSSIYVLS